MNIATIISQKMYEMSKATDRKVQEYATEPYGQRKLTQAEQMSLYKSLTPDKMFEAIQNMKTLQEFEDWNKWLFRMEQKEGNNGL